MKSFAVEAYHSETEQIVTGVFQTMFGCEVYPIAEVWQVPPPAVTAAIYFAGSWRGAVLVETTELQARHWTARLMSIPVPEKFTDDVQDAMGELVNMVGGNLKSVLPKGVGLSMPSVVQGSSYSLRICGGNLTHRQAFLAEDGPFSVTLVEMLEK